MTESVKQTHVLMSKRKLRNLLIQAFGQGKGDVWESSFSNWVEEVLEKC